jgi:hypothetical protein
MEAETVLKELIRAGVRPQLIYAACKTGRLVSEENRSVLLPEDINEWENALKEYKEKYPQNDWDMKNLDNVINREKF